MAIPVPASGVPLAFDALPALKARHYWGSLPGGHIYTLARLYALNGDLALSLAAFERAPDEASRVEFAVCGEGFAPLRLTLGRAGARLALDESARPLAQPAATPTGGSDEQGWYWGADLVLPAGLLALAGCRLAPGAAFYAGLFKSRLGEDALCSAFPLAEAGAAAPAGFGRFEVFSY